MKRYLGIDLETFSATDLTACGVHRYVEDPEFAVLLFGFAWDEEPVKVLDLTAGEHIPEDVLEALTDPGVIKSAWNAPFEMTCLRAALGLDIDPAQWEDTMVLAGVCGLPLGLGDAGRALGLPEDKAKDRDGKALIRWFCVPCKPTKKNPGTRHLPEAYPEKWERFKAYNGQDVVAEREIRLRLARWAPSGVERRAWAVDQAINNRGVRVDLTLASAAVELDRRNKAELTEQAMVLTGLQNPNSVAQIKTWLMEQEGVEVPSLNKKVLPDVIAGLSTDRARQFMDLRAELAKSSTKKYDAVLRSACADEHIRGCFQFYGASRTGRWSGRRVQLQNLSKNKMKDLGTCRALVRSGDFETTKLLYDGVSSVLSELVRTTLIPEQGHRFIVCDYSAIEARVLAWIAGEEWALEEFRGAGQIYEATGAKMFNVPKETIAKGGANHDKRQAAKTAVLACGYGGGVNALLAFGADKMGMTEEDMVRTVDLWREANHRAVLLWKDLERTAIRCVVHQAPQRSRIGGIRFDYESGILWMTLPSGRRIAYFGARYGESRWHRGRRVLSYMGTEQKTGRWTRLETWGGKLTENCWAAGTPVLTDRGWVPIERVTTEDRLWDGTAWVNHAGLFRPGEKETILLDGLSVTPDHLILTTEGWTFAEKCEGLYRAHVQLPDCTVRARPRLSVGTSARPAGRKEPVFDLLNAGPRHRYVVLGQTGPMLVHNCVQATARDCLRDAMIALSDAGFEIRAHIHDEVVISEPKDGRTLEDVAEIMSRPLPWAPGLPLRGDGYYCDYYVKD